MVKGLSSSESPAQPIPLTVLILWAFGGVSFALIVYLFTPYTHNLDDIKVTLQCVLAPIVWGFFAVALYCGYIRRIHPLILLTVFAFMLIMLAAAILARFPWRAWRDVLFQLTIMAPFLVVVGTCTTARRFRNMALFYYLIGCGTVAFGLFHYFGCIGFLFRAIYPEGIPPGRFAPLYTLLFTLRQNDQMLSTILNRDFYPAYLLMILPLGMAFAIYYRHWLAQMFFVLTFFLMCLCVVVSFSKDTYLALFLMLCTFLVPFAMHHNWRAVPRQTLLVWIGGAVVVFAVLLFVVRERIFSIGATMPVSIASRKIIWGGAIGIFYDAARPLGETIKHLFVGSGPGSFFLAFPIYRNPDYHLYQISNVTLFAHNQYLGLLCEMGLLGLITFLTFLGTVAWFLFREVWRKPSHQLNVFQLALLSSIVGISFQNISSPNIRWTVCGFNYWFMLGLCVAAFHLTFSEKKQRRIDSFYRFSPQLRSYIVGAFLVFALAFEAVSIPYGLMRFNAAKNNNHGLILLNEFSQLCNMQLQPKYKGNPQFIEQTRQRGLETAETFRRAIKWMPSFITSHYKLAHVYSRLASSASRNPTEQAEYWQMAKATYDELARYGPDYSEIHLNYGILGRVFYQTTRNHEHLVTSLVKFRRATQMSNKLPVQNYYFETLQMAGSLAATSSTKQADIVTSFAVALRLTSDTLKADEEWVERQLTEIENLIDAGQIRKAGDMEADLFTEMAVRVAEKIPTLKNTAGREGRGIVRAAREMLKRYYISTQQYDKVLPVLEDLLKVDPDNSGHLRLHTDAALKAGQPRRCLELCAKMIERNPLNWTAREAARGVLEITGEYCRAFDQSEALVKILERTYAENPRLNDPKQGPALRRSMGNMPSMAEVYYRAGFAAEKCDQKLDMALEYYTKAVKMDPNGPWGKLSSRSINRIMPRMKQAPGDATPPTVTPKKPESGGGPPTKAPAKKPVGIGPGR